MSESSRQQTSQIKLLVDTASEAVNVLRERYGDRAKVLSVKQVEAGGLKRLISKPRLEVIAEVPNESAQGQTEQPREPGKQQAPAAKKAPADEPAEKQAIAKSPASPSDRKSDEPEPKKPHAVGKLYAQRAEETSQSYFSQFGETNSVSPSADEQSPTEAPLGSAANPVRSGTLDAVKRAISMLESVGFDRSLIERVRAEVDFKNIGSLPAMDLYARICDWLRSRIPNTEGLALAPSRAFIGCSGVGKTAALCKALSAEVFVQGMSPSVLKIDSDLPNPSDGLEVFCDIMGAPLARAIEEIEDVSASRPLLVDMPGFSLSEPDSIEACRDTLDELGVEERILVVNAAYEAELIAEILAAGEAIGATRVVFTHLDETRRAGKLWKFLLNGRITPLFFSVGPNPAGDYTFETYSHLLERTFPNGRQLAAASARHSRSQSGRSREEASLKS